MKDCGQHNKGSNEKEIWIKRGIKRYSYKRFGQDDSWGCWIWFGLWDLIFNDNSCTFLNSFYSTPYSAIRDTSNAGYCFDDEYVQIRHKAFSYTSEEVRDKIIGRIKELLDVYKECLAINPDLEYKHLFREVK